MLYLKCSTLEGKSKDSPKVESEVTGGREPRASRQEFLCTRRAAANTATVGRQCGAIWPSLSPNDRPNASLAPPDDPALRKSNKNELLGGCHYISPGIEGVMKQILYLDLKSNRGTTDEILRDHGHRLVATCSYVDALGKLRSRSFDAVVIDNEDENPEVLDFTVQAHCLRPELPVFLTVDWGDELPMALESLGNTVEFGQVTLRDRFGPLTTIYSLHYSSERSDSQAG